MTTPCACCIHCHVPSTRSSTRSHPPRPLPRLTSSGGWVVSMAAFLASGLEDCTSTNVPVGFKHAVAYHREEESRSEVCPLLSRPHHLRPACPLPAGSTTSSTTACAASRSLSHLWMRRRRQVGWGGARRLLAGGDWYCVSLLNCF